MPALACTGCACCADANDALDPKVEESWQPKVKGHWWRRNRDTLIDNSDMPATVIQAGGDWPSLLAK